MHIDLDLLMCYTLVNWVQLDSNKLLMIRNQLLEIKIMKYYEIQIYQKWFPK